MTVPEVIDRERLLAQLRERREWDVVIIGGGATGLGIALDASARGFRTALIEARDFASGTSSRSTKLIHGGVRYLAQGNVKLVREALSERALLLANAPRLVRPLKFIVPCYRLLEREFMRVGLGIYDALAGRQGIGDTHWLSRAETIARLPGVKTHGLLGGVEYWDAQFDDARLAIALMRTAVRTGAVAVNYVEAERIDIAGGRVGAIVAHDVLSAERFELRAKVVFNTTGVWADQVRRQLDATAAPLTVVSRGSHIVVPSSFLPGAAGMMIPRTTDGRVLFAIPWRERLMIGTTDVAANGPTWTPEASEAEIDFILATARSYLQAAPSAGDVLATFAGLRPLFSPRAAHATKTISREHAIVIERQNLITVIGGKWTTYRKMALDALNQAATAGLLDARLCTTAGITLDVDESVEAACSAAEASVLAGGGADIASYVRLAARHEQAHRGEDVIARRLRVESIDRAAALKAMPAVQAALTVPSPHP
ncbi:MAG TPA: glycerol-3-phosphate dehydrogenase/oxidase [Burkholderiaceae bacterium]|jgi:glycerol-3-phosphate dehydrogenase|nr:glycerol-3-phosphate dehydrogenase/oxidase [Burkholderiaceae bacterium]